MKHLKISSSIAQSIVAALVLLTPNLSWSFTPDAVLEDTRLINPGNITSSMFSSNQVTIPIINPMPGYEVGWVAAVQGVSFFLDDDVITLSSRRGSMVEGNTTVVIYYQDDRGYIELEFDWNFVLEDVPFSAVKSEEPSFSWAEQERVAVSLIDPQPIEIPLNNPDRNAEIGWLSAPQGIALSVVDDTVVLTPQRGQIELGVYTAEIYYEGLDDYEVLSFEIEVLMENDAPVVTSPFRKISLEGEEVSIQIEATNEDWEAISFEGLAFPEGVSIDSETGVISGYPSVAGVYASEIIVTDEAGQTDTATFEWIVNFAPWYVDLSEEGTNSSYWWAQSLPSEWLDALSMTEEAVLRNYLNLDGSVEQQTLLPSRHGLLALMSYGWAHSEALGWIYKVGDWVYNQRNGWLYSSPEDDGFYYRQDQGDWIFVTENGATYSFATESWE